MFSRFRKVFCLLSLIAFLPGFSVAQSTYTAQLNGVVTDSSGGVIVGARVILIDVATNIPAIATTDGRGIYVFTGLRPATYTMRVEAPNFASVERKDVVLGVSQQASLDIVVTPGSISMFPSWSLSTPSQPLSTNPSLSSSWPLTRNRYST